MCSEEMSVNGRPLCGSAKDISRCCRFPFAAPRRGDAATVESGPRSAEATSRRRPEPRGSPASAETHPRDDFAGGAQVMAEFVSGAAGGGRCDVPASRFERLEREGLFSSARARRLLVHGNKLFAGEIRLTKRPEWVRPAIASPRHWFSWFVWSPEPRAAGIDAFLRLAGPMARALRRRWPRKRAGRARAGSSRTSGSATYDGPVALPVVWHRRGRSSQGGCADGSFPSRGAASLSARICPDNCRSLRAMTSSPCAPTQ
jgi:hypothetical protein